MIRARFATTLADFSLRVDIDFPAPGVTAVTGPSGSGKTTLLRCIAGLEKAHDGYLEVAGQVWQDSTCGIFLPTHRRALGYVFQEASLLAHLDVRGNLRFGYARTPATGRRVAWEQAVELLGVGSLLQRMPDGLSGGERQRVAIARAILASPQLLLMDEPLAGLDAARKIEILPFLERLHVELDIPVVYVSHNIDEVARLAAHVVLLDAGCTIAAGPLERMLARLDLPTARDEDAGVVVIARAIDHDENHHLTRLEFSGGSFLVARQAITLGQQVRLHVRARDVSLTLSEHQDSSILNRFAATVEEIAATDNPANLNVRLDIGAGTPLLARITHRSRENLQLEVGRRVWAQVKTAALLH